MPEDHFVDLDGNEVDFYAWMQLADKTKVGRILKQHTLPDGRLLRTVWCGTEFPSVGVRAFGTAIMTAAGKYITEIGQYSERDVAERCHEIHFGQISASTLELAREQKTTDEGPEAMR